MADLKRRLIQAGFAGFAATRLHRLAAPLTRGRGAILTFHHVRPWIPRDFAPNRLLEITPSYLDAVLHRIKASGYRIVPLAEVGRALASNDRRRFVALTFDDGYRDNLVHALPILASHEAPFTIFVTTGFADRTARLWWLELEDIIRRSEHLSLGEGWPGSQSVPLRTLAEKHDGFRTLARLLVGQHPDRLLATIDALATQSGGPAASPVEDLCMDWGEIRELAAHPLVTIGCHTRAHANLATLDSAALHRDLSDSRASIEDQTGRPALHLAYPYGSASAAGPREFAAARASGFASAVTTRPAMLFDGHSQHVTALPRMSVNGLWQQAQAFDILLSGAPFAVWNGGRRLNVS